MRYSGTDSPILSDYEVVIGMDIISRGDFVFTNHEGHSTFSFRIPSEEEIVLK